MALDFGKASDVRVSLREYGALTVPKETAQIANSFLPENAARMLGYARKAESIEWRMHPTVRPNMAIWHLGGGHLYPLWSDPAHQPYQDDKQGSETLFGYPVTFDPTLPELGQEGDVLLTCDAGTVRLYKRD